MTYFHCASKMAQNVFGVVSSVAPRSKRGTIVRTSLPVISSTNKLRQINSSGGLHACRMRCSKYSRVSLTLLFVVIRHQEALLARAVV